MYSVERNKCRAVVRELLPRSNNLIIPQGYFLHSTTNSQMRSFSVVSQSHCLDILSSSIVSALFLNLIVWTLLPPDISTFAPNRTVFRLFPPFVISTLFPNPVVHTVLGSKSATSPFPNELFHNRFIVLPQNTHVNTV